MMVTSNDITQRECHNQHLQTLQQTGGGGGGVTILLTMTMATAKEDPWEFSLEDCVCVCTHPNSAFS